MKLTDEQIEKIYQSFDCLIPKSLIKKVLKKRKNVESSIVFFANFRHLSFEP